MLTKTLVNSDIEKELLNILQTRPKSNASWKLAKRRYEKLISQERLFFLKNRGSYAAFLANQNANAMEKNLKITLENKRS